MAMTDGLFVHGHRGLVRPQGLHTKNFVYLCIDILQSGCPSYSQTNTYVIVGQPCYKCRQKAEIKPEKK